MERTTVELSEGQLAPDIDATSSQGNRFSLAEQRGKWVVVYFFPRSNTPGWCHEAEDFQSHRAELESLNALVVGVSADSVDVQRRFIDRFLLEFPLIADRDKTIIDAYGAREVLGITAKRRTFLIDPEGKIAHIWPKVKVEGHGDDVVSTIRALQGVPR